MSSPCIRRVICTFNRDDVEVSITYSHDSSEATATPGSKKRTTTAERMARKGLERALEALDVAEVVWGGFATDTHLTTDVVVLDRKNATPKKLQHTAPMRAGPASFFDHRPRIRTTPKSETKGARR